MQSVRKVASEAQQTRPGHWAIVVLGLAVAVLAGPFLSKTVQERDSQVFSPYTPAHEYLLAGYGGRFPVEPRLSASLARKPIPPSTPARASQAFAFDGKVLDQRIRAAAAVERDLSERPTSETRAASGIRHLLDGATDHAIAALEVARLERPSDFRIVNDLAAAYLVSGLAGGAALHALQGLKLAHQAVEMAPKSPEACFNLALAFDEFQLRHAARDQWERYLELDPTDSQWREEALRRLLALERPTATQRWEEHRSSLRALADRGQTEAVGEVVRAFPEHSLEEVEGWLLVEWPASIESRELEEARATLGSIRLVARQLPEGGGGALVLAATDRLRSEDSRVDLQVLAQDYRDLGESASIVERLETSAASALLLRTSAGLSARGDVYAPRARFLLALCRYQETAYEEAAWLAKAAKQEAEAVGDPLTLVRSAQILGVLESVQLNHPAALIHYQDALARSANLGWWASVAATEGLSGEVLGRMGDREGAWKARFEALRLISEVWKPRIRLRIWDDATRDIAAHSPGLALDFMREVMDVAHEAGLPIATIVALEQRASVFLRLGQKNRALDDLVRAEQWVDQISDQAVAEVFTGTVLAMRGQVMARDEPALALAELERAIEIFEKTGYDLGMPAILASRARSRSALGDTLRAARDLDNSLRRLESAGSKLDPRHRLRAAIAARETYEELVSLYVAAGHPERALSVVERSSWRLRSGSLLGASEVQAHRIPPGSAILVYWVAQDRLLVWVVRREGVSWAEIPVTKDILESKIDELRRAIRWNAEPARPAAELHSLLVAPVAGRLTAVSELIIVPDGWVHRVPFALLQDPHRKRRLIEDFTITVGATVGDAVAASAVTMPSFDSTSRVLAVANPSIDFPAQWNPLAEAEREIRVIATKFPRSRVLMAEAASESRVVRQLGQYEIAHFATHVMGGADTAGGSLLLLAPDGADGVVASHEILDLDLTGTGLVVLSSCGSGLGPAASGSLPRSFLEAGAASVVAALWDVSDRSTTLFMSYFYGQLREGLRPSEALRRAQLACVDAGMEVCESGAWAAFQVLVGQPWKPEGTEVR